MILIIIPAYNEEKKIQSVVSSVVNLGYDVLVVNDGSADATRNEAEKGGARVVSHFINRGYGAALSTGHSYALQKGYAIAAHFDADGQHNPGEIADIIKPIQQGAADAVIGSRFLESDANMRIHANDTNRETMSNVPLVRKVLIKLATTFTWVISGIKLTDAHNGFRAFSRAALEKIVCKQDGMSYASEVIDQIAEHGLRFIEVPNTITYTDYSRGKGESNVKKILIGIRFLWGKLVQ